jgi:hypothetical protein
MRPALPVGTVVGRRFWPSVRYRRPEDWPRPLEGTIISVLDPRAWAKSHQFPEVHPDPSRVADHCQRHSIHDDTELFVPVVWTTTRDRHFVLWEHRVDLVPYERDLDVWEKLKSEIALSLPSSWVDGEPIDGDSDRIFFEQQGVPEDLRAARFWNPNTPNFDYRKAVRRDYRASRDFLDYVWNEAADRLLLELLDQFGLDYYALLEDEIPARLSGVTGRPFNKVELTPVLDEHIRYRLGNLGIPDLPRTAKGLKALDYLRKSRERGPSSQFGLELGALSCTFCRRTIGDVDFPRDRNVRAYHMEGKPFCSACVYIFNRFKRRPDGDETLARFQSKLASRVFLDSIICEVCSREFKYADHLFKYDPEIFYPNSVIDVCPRCLTKAISPYNRCSPALAIARIRDIHAIVGDEMLDGFTDLLVTLKDANRYRALLGVLVKSPNEDQLKQIFGHYLKALIEAGIVSKEQFTITEGAFGIRCLADDGHVCDSLREREIDNFLHSRGIRHEREPAYPRSKQRADWKVIRREREFYVEYFGLITRDEYRKRAEGKIQLAENCGIILLAIYPYDDWLEKLQSALE